MYGARAGRGSEVAKQDKTDVVGLVVAKYHGIELSNEEGAAQQWRRSSKELIAMINEGFTDEISFGLGAKVSVEARLLLSRLLTVQHNLRIKVVQDLKKKKSSLTQIC